MLSEKVNKEVRLKWGRGRRGHVSVLRENYFRDDVSCKSEICILPECSQQSHDSELLVVMHMYMLALILHLT